MTAEVADALGGIADAVGALGGSEAPRRPGRKVATSYADIAPMETLWLWRERIPLGEVTLIAGEGGVSKGLTLVDLAARVSTGRPMPGEDEGCEPGSVVMITPEDDLQETVAHRLRAQGADLTRIHDLTYLPGGSPFELSAAERKPGDVAHLRAAIDAIGDVRLVVIDPMMATVAYGSVATNLGARRLVTPLQRMAKETGVAVVVSHHTVKSGAIAGSKGLIDALRVVYRIARDPENPAFRVMSLEKSNVLGATEDLRYTLAGEGHSTRVEWVDRDEMESRRTAWRERLAGRQAAKPTAAQAKAAGCRHSSTKFGTLAQCSDCPARRLRTAPAASGATQSVSRPSGSVVTRPAGRERRWGAAVSAEGGHQPVGAGKFPSEAAAKAACEGVAGPLVWRELPGKAGTMVASTAEGVVYAVAAG